MSYWDTSALLKLYQTEPDSGKFVSHASTCAEVVTAFIGPYEALAAFRRREAEGVIGPGGAEICYQKLIGDIRCGRIRLIPESGGLGREFANIVNHCHSQAPAVFVRTNDGIHLAAAKVDGQSKFVTADIRQAVAARLMGLDVEP